MRTYNNPVIAGTCPDPSICRAGSDYYLVASSFEYFPGVPLYHSRDLASWKQVGHVLCRPSQLSLRGVASSKGIFAPTIRYHSGVFYVVTTAMEGGGSFYVTATDPAGDWSEPVWLPEDTFTMDPSLFFDDDGRVYYTRHGEGERGGIFQAELDLASGRLLDKPRLIWRGTGDIWPEGPHLYKAFGTYYLLISEGGTSFEHQLTVARSDSPWGPFEPCPHNPILTHRHLPDNPIQAVGHADLVTTEDGAWWAVLLGVRPSTPRHHHIGRETFLVPVEWQDGWPRVLRPLALEMNGAGLPGSGSGVAPRAQHSRHNFAAPRLEVGWQHVRHPIADNYSLTERPGYLRLRGGRASAEVVGEPTAILRPQNAHRVRLATALDFEPSAGEQAGLIVRGNEDNHHTVLVERDGDLRVAVARARMAGVTQELGRTTLRPGPVELVAEGGKAAYRFAVRQGGTETPLGEAPTHCFAYEQTGSFTGAFVGVYAYAGQAQIATPADFAWFEMSPRSSSPTS